MHRSRLALSSFATVALLLATQADPAAATGRTQPWVSRVSATTHWVTDTVGDRMSWYVFDVTLYVRDLKSGPYTDCVTVTYSDGTRYPDSGIAFPRTKDGAEVATWLQFGPIPAGVTSVTVTAQVMRMGGRDCCRPVGNKRTISATLPTPPPLPPAPSEPQLVFDVTFPTP